MKFPFIALTLSALLLSACSSDTAASTSTDSVVDALENEIAEIEEVSRNIPEFPRANEETMAVQPGQFGWPCADADGQANNGECDSGFCIQDANHQLICTHTCVDSCPTDFVCKQATGSDAVFICLPSCVKDIEVCDGVDNDCNQQIDEGTCDDGNPCSHDSCTEKKCKHEKLTGTTCSDGNACTQTDECVNGTCTGGNPQKCTDGNVCTQDNVCKPIDGCVFPPVSGSCEDGSVCTVEDTCTEGECATGKPRKCFDNNPCTLDACDPKKLPTGCFFKPAPDGPNNSCPKSVSPGLIPWCTKGACGFQKN